MGNSNMTNKGCAPIDDKENGLTFLELVIVIFITTILAIAFFNSPTTATLDANSEAQRLASELRYVQLLAMTQETRYRVNFINTTQYTLTQLNGTTAISHAGLRGGNTITLSPSFNLSTSNLPNNYIVFGTSGEPYINNLIPGTALTTPATITITGDDQTASISITPSTGMISIPN